MSFLFSDPNAAQRQSIKQSGQFIGQGVNAISGQQGAQAGDWQQTLGLLRSLLSNPLSMNDQTTQNIINRSNSAAQEGAAAQTRALGAAAGAKGDVRSGSTQRMQERINVDLGSKMSDNVRQALIQQAVSRPQDLMNAAGAMGQGLQGQNQLTLALAQLLGGGGQSFAGLAGNQAAHPNQSGLQTGLGLGQLLGLLFT